PPAAVPAGNPKDFDDAVVALIDELAVKDPALFAKIRSEQARIRALPTREQRAAAVKADYPLLERDLDRSAAQGKLSPAGAALWAAFRPQAQAALADGTLFERAQFAGKAFDEKVQRLLDTGTVLLDADRKLPDSRPEYMEISRRVHTELSIPGN